MLHITKKVVTITGICGLLLNTNLFTAFSARQESGIKENVAAASGCSIIYNGSNGWVIDKCTTDPGVATPMQVFVDGISIGDAALIRIYHKSQTWSGTPQVAVIYASGFVRLKQNADPSPSIPFGTSFVLGPAYWPSSSTYYHNPQLSRLEIDTKWLPNAPLRMTAEGTNHSFDVTYDMTLPPPSDRQTRLHVIQTYTSTANININSTRRAERQGFKLVQASSMFINQNGSCDGGYTECHDSNGVRYISNSLSRRQVNFANLTLPAFVFGTTSPLGNTWLDVLHTDDKSWQSQTGANTSGNTPNVRIALDEMPTTHTVTPQGWISSTTNPNNDNVGLWLHDDGQASVSWQAGQSDQVSYWLMAQDDPPEPWTELGLRPGLTFLDFDGNYDCSFVKDNNQSTTGSVAAISGYSNKAFKLSYNLGSNNGNWTQVRCNFDPPLNLSAYDHLRFDWRGDPSAANSLEIGLINPTNGGEHIFARGYHHPTHRAWWGQMVIPFNFLYPWTNNTQFDPSKVSALFISVVKDPVDDTGGSGSIAIDNLSAYNVFLRTTPSNFETIEPNSTSAQMAANWLASQQKSTGLLKSWEEESSCVAHTYDQALALIVFSSQGMWTEADAVVDGLINTQNADGSWYKSRNCSTLTPIDNSKWEGDIAWAVYAMRKYLDLGGTHGQASTALQDGADWLATRVNSADGCLVIDHTEGTIDAWWAFHAAGASHAGDANNIKNCLLTYYWDNSMGRFKGGRDWWQPYLDNQTWGAAFLKEIGEMEKARRALSYARDIFLTPAQGGQLFGFDGQAGPWSVWNEGTGQYVSLGGDGASELLLEILAQQRDDGAMVGSPDEFNGGGVWTTRWHGVAPTAWLYNALCGEPFSTGCHPTASSLDFGDQLFRTSNPAKTITVNNTQGSSITLGTLQGSSSVGITWASSKSFFIENDTCSGAILSSGASCTFKVKFLPWSLGAKTGTITIPSNATNGPYIYSLTGTAIPGTQLLLNRSFDNYAVSTGLPNLWSKSPLFKIGIDGVDDSWAFHGPYSVKLVGDGDLKILSQMVDKSGGPGDDFSFFVTMHAEGIPNDADRWLMQVMFYNGSTIVENRNVKLKTGTYDFKRITQTYTATTNYTHIMFRIHFGKSSGTAWVDLSSLTWAP